jgi:WD40 repeat protein
VTNIGDRWRTPAARYGSFMSYSHAADGKLAPALQRGIQRLGKPFYRRPIIRVFRDETSLSANPSLWSGIQAALEQCEYFLLMCSVKSAASPWVQKEVEWWLGHRTVARLLLIVTDGEIAWDPQRADFDWKRTTCLPPLLRGCFGEEPYFVDLRWARNRDDLSLRNTRFRAAVLTLAASLHGKPMDELDSEDIRQQRWLRIVASITVVVVSVLVIASAVERRSAKDESAKAESRRIAAKSVELLDGKKSIDKAIVLGVVAWRISPTDEARSALEKLGTASGGVAAILGQHTGSIESQAFGPTNDQTALLATGGDDGLIMLWHIPDGTSAGPPIVSDQSMVEAIQFSDNGEFILSSGVSGKTDEDPGHGTIILHNLTSKTNKQVPTDFLFGKTYLIDSAAMSLSPDGRLVALQSGNKIAVWNAATGNVRQKISAGGFDTVCLQFATNSRLLWASSSEGGSRVTLNLWDLETDRTRVGPTVQSPGRYGDETDVKASCSKDGSRVAVWGGEAGPPVLYTSSDDMSMRMLPFPDTIRIPDGQSNYRISFDGIGKRVAVNWKARTVVWDVAEHKVLRDVNLAREMYYPPYLPVALSWDGRWLAVANGNVAILDVTGQEGESPARTLNAACTLTGIAEEECIRRLCEKVSPLITDKTLRDALQPSDYELLKQIHWSQACAPR